MPSQPVEQQIRLHMDFETFATVDLKVVGTSEYAKHRNTEPLMLSYATQNDKTQIWVPAETVGERGDYYSKKSYQQALQDDIPDDLEDKLLDPVHVKIAWNKPFEWNIFTHTVGIHIPHNQWRCSMVLAYSLSLPGKLKEAGRVMGLPEHLQKDPRGDTLMRKFSSPRKAATKAKPWIRNNHLTDPEDWRAYKEYCITDTDSERALFQIMRKWNLPREQWELWFLDQEINEAGIPVNMRVVNNAIEVYASVVETRLQEMKEITGLANPNSGAQLLPWLRAEGYPYQDLKKGHITKALEKLSEDVTDGTFCFEEIQRLWRVLELRQEVSKASVKKYAALQRTTGKDGLLRNTLQFCGAGRTWRWAGRIYQPQNLAKPAPYLEAPEKQYQAVKFLERFDAPLIEFLYDYPMDVLSTCVRPVVQAPEGYMLIDADLNAIENRGIGFLANDRKILDVFEEGRDPYVDFATHWFKKSYEELWHEYKVLKNKKRRTLSKAPVLGCFGPDTLVLTKTGWKRIVEVQNSDLVFDGIDFVSHEGVIDQGLKETVTMSCVQVTMDHEFLIKEQTWKQVKDAVTDDTLLRQATDTARGLLLKRLNQHVKGDTSIAADVIAALFAYIQPETSPTKSLLDAIRVRLEVEDATSESRSERKYTTSSLTGSTPYEVDAQTQRRKAMKVMEAGESNAGLNLLKSLSGMWSRNFNMPEKGRLIEWITMAITKKETYVLRRGLNKTAIVEILRKFYTKAKLTAPRSLEGFLHHDTGKRRIFFERGRMAILRRRSSKISPDVKVLTTYDVLNAGPRNRFTILTNAGPLIVHNCGYRLSGGTTYENAETGETEATGLLGYAWNMGIMMTPQESESAVRVWRDTYPDIVQFWYDLERAAQLCVRTGRPQVCRRLSFEMSGFLLRMKLPSGRYINYVRPKIENKVMPWGKEKAVLTYEGLNDKNQWTRLTTHGGKILENGCQGISRDVLGHGMMLAKKEGIDLRMHVHDQAVGLSLKHKADQELKTLIRCLTTPAPWAKGFPLAAEGLITPCFIKD